MNAISQTDSLSRSRRRFICIVLVPILLILFLFSLVPIIANVVVSLYNYSPLGGSRFILFGNYRKLPTLDGFGKTVANTFAFALSAALINIVMALVLALCVNSSRIGVMRNSLRTVFFMPVVLPMVAVAFIWNVMYDAQAGIINSVLKLLGFAGNYHWLMDEALAMPAVIAVTLWADLGYNIVLFIAGLEGIPKTFIEAARMDGAGSATVFWKILLPLLQRTMLFVCVMTLISYFQAFSQIHIMTKGGPDQATLTLAYSIYQYGFVFQSMGTAAAMSVVLMVIILAASAFQLLVGKTKWSY